MKRLKYFNTYQMAVVLFLTTMLFGFPMMGNETLCYTERVTDAPSFDIYTGNGDSNNPIMWQHHVPAGILENVVRVGLYIEAYDVDYPSDDEHDRVFFNGNDLGILEGSNNTWYTVEKTVPKSFIKEGINDLKISVDELNKDWKVTIRASEIRFYCSSATPDFVLGISPASGTVQAGYSASYTVSITPLNGFKADVQLEVQSVPAGFKASFDDNPLSPGGSTQLIVTPDSGVPSGTYKMTVTGTADGITHTKEISLKVEGYLFQGHISKSFEPTMAYPGEEVQMKITLKNKGNTSIKDAVVWDTISKDLLYVSDDAGVPVTWEGARAIWKFPKISRKSEKVFFVRLKVDPSVSSGKIKNRAYLNHNSLKKPVISNTAVLQIRGYKVTIQKSVDKTNAKPGDFLKYSLEIRNDSAVSLSGITIKDKLDPYLQFVSQDGSWGFNHEGDNLIWSGDMKKESTVTIPFSVQVRPDVPAGTRISNSAVLEVSGREMEEQSNMVWTAIQADPIDPSGIVFRKKAEIPQVRVGRITRFRFTIHNNTSAYLLNTMVEDILPQGFSYVANTSLLDNMRVADPSGKRRLVWNLPSIKSRQTVTLRFQVVIGADAKRGRNINRGVLTVLDNSGKTHRLEASEFINVETSGIIFYSGVEGKVFIDDDEDGFFSPGDRPLKGIEVRLSTGQKVMTPENGSFKFEQLFPGEYAVGINTITLPEKFKLSSPSPVFVGLSDGMMDYVEFLVVFNGETEMKESRLQGRVFFDKNQNMTYDGDDVLLKEFKVLLDGTQSTRGEWGNFVFSHIPQGLHEIEILYDGGPIRQKVQLEKGKNMLEFPLKFTGIEIRVRGQK